MADNPQPAERSFRPPQALDGSPHIDKVVVVDG